MKYIIELPEEPLSILALSTIKGIPKATKIETFEPYTEPDRKAIENEVWEIARLISLEVYDGGLNRTDLNECYKSVSIQEVMKNYSYQEAKAKYEAWKKQKDEIRVGCEVHHKGSPELKIYVTDMDDNSFGGFALCRVKDVCDYGDRFSECNVHQYKPTGRVFPNIVELLKKMEDEK